jgi:hypothetical protein
LLLVLHHSRVEAVSKSSHVDVCRSGSRIHGRRSDYSLVLAPLIPGELRAMSRLRSFLVALLLASMPGTDGEAIAKQQLGNLGSARRGVLLPANPTLTQSATTAVVVQLPNGASSISELWQLARGLPTGREEKAMPAIANPKRQPDQSTGVRSRASDGGGREVGGHNPHAVRVEARLRRSSKDSRNDK